MSDVTLGIDSMGAQDVHVLTFSLASLSGNGLVSFFEKVLSQDERERLARLRLETARDEFRICRGVLRYVIGVATRTQPAEIEFGYGEFGKPFIKFPQTDLHFNLAHSGGWAVLALTRSGEVGVDLEVVREVRDWEAIAARYFSQDDCVRLSQIDAARRMDHFFHMWSQKEALLKAMGVGISRSSDFPIMTHSHEDEFADKIYEYGANAWWVRSLEVGAGLQASLCVKNSPHKITVYYHNDKSVTFCLKNIVGPG